VTLDDFNGNTIGGIQHKFFFAVFIGIKSNYAIELVRIIF
jgi:hypothetical protein